MSNFNFGAFAGQLGIGLLNNALSQMNANDQRAWQEKMWQKQAEYNDPSAMADRLRRAGLNPFVMTGAEPAGSAGTGALAQTFPLPDPLSALKIISEVENLSATTGKVETETEQVLKNIAMLDVMLQKGLVEKDEYEFRLSKMKESWEKRNPFDVELDKTESETKENLSEVAKNEASVAVANAEVGLKESETALADARASYVSAQEEYQRILSSNANAESKARVEQMFAAAQASLAAAHESRVRAEVAEIQKTHLSNEEQRAQEMHVIKKQAAEYARDLGATEAQIAELHLAMEERWTSDLPVWGNVLDFVHHNINLGGSVSKAFK